MFNLLLGLRVFTLAAFIISNAIICSVAAWSLSIAKATSYSSGLMQVAGYLIFLGAFALVVVFSLLFAEVMRSSSRTTTVWFELLWIGFFFLLEFVGAVALSAQWPNRMCMAVAPAYNAPCQSITVLMAFTWMIAIILMAYFLALLASAALHHRDDSQVWRASVTSFPWYRTKFPLASPRAAPSLFVQKETVSIVAPKPRHPAPAALFSYRGGINSEYEIEHYQQSSLPKEPLPVPPVPTQPQYPPHRSVSHDVPAQSTSLYPQYVQTSTEVQPPPVAAAPGPALPLKPIGDWPRADTSAPQRQKTGRQIRYQNISRPNAPPQTQATPVPTTTTAQQPPITSAPSTTPAVPRTPTSRYQRARPPPLDLSAVRAYDSARARR